MPCAGPRAVQPHGILVPSPKRVPARVHQAGGSAGERSDDGKEPFSLFHGSSAVSVRAVCLVVTGMALAACAAVPPAPPLSSSTPAVTFSQIDFGPRAAMASELWTAVNRVASAHSLEGTPFQEGGNFFTATWCPSAALERCSRGFVADSGMTLQFRAARYTQHPLQAVGLSLDVTNLPGDKDAWGAAATFGDGDAVITDSFAVELLRKAARDQFPARTEGPLPPEDSFRVGDALAYEVALGNTGVSSSGVIRPVTTVRVTSDISAVEQVKAFTGSDLAMTTRMKDRLALMRAEVVSTLDRHEAQVCTVGAQGAVPPPCPRRDMTPEEESAAKTVATAYFDQQGALLEREHVGIFSTIDELFPWATAIRQVGPVPLGGCAGLDAGASGVRSPAAVNRGAGTPVPGRRAGPQEATARHTGRPRRASAARRGPPGAGASRR